MQGSYNYATYISAQTDFCLTLSKQLLLICCHSCLANKVLLSK